jgi:eukaryotic-like serine/threonine-protein kinase
MKAFTRWFARRSAATRHDAPPLRPDALVPGTVLGGVSIAQAVGRGASAVVYRGLDVATQGPRAVKVWSPRTGADADTAAREHFLQEARRVAGLEHPGIVRVHGSGSHGGLSFIVSELFTDGSLARFTQPPQRLAAPQVLAIAAQLADALGHAHRNGIVHRDVKPSNALFDAAAQRAALCDFGIARAPDAQASRSGVLLGSPVYMAPELLAGQRADARSDLYALGVLTYELLAGRAPFEAASMGALLRSVAQSPPPPLATLRPDWPAAATTRLDALLAAVLAKDPSRRPADAAAWAAAVREAEGWLICAANATNPS